MSPSLRKVALVATPLAAMVTLALGLHIGAPDAVRAAIVHAAPPSAAKGPLVWQVVTIDEKMGVRQPASMAKLTVVARAGAREATWSGSTNQDGVAEIVLDLPGVRAGDPMTLSVRAEGERLPLADGPVQWWPRQAERAEASWARYARREGDVKLDVAVYGQRLAAGFTSAIWVRASDSAGKPLAGATIAIEPETSLSIASSQASTDDHGWASLAVQPVTHAATLVLAATTPGGKKGAWVGALPIAPGAAHVEMPARLAPGEKHTFKVVVPTVRPVAYVEIDDAQGRVAAAALPVSADERGAQVATFEAPPLPEGLYWLVTSGDPYGASTMSPATIARPFLVASSDEAALRHGPLPDVCIPDSRQSQRALGPCAAVAWGGPFHRWSALEGFAARRAHEHAKRGRGMTVALVALFVAAVLETLLVLQGVIAARRKLRGEVTQTRFGALQLGVGLLIGLLGFALIAGLILRAA